MSEPQSQDPSLSVYLPGLKVACRAAAAPVAYLGHGWHPPEADFTWMDGPEAELVFLLRLPDGPLRLRLDLVPFVHGEALQTVEVFLNGLRLGFREVPDARQVVFDVPMEAFRGRVCRIALHCATARVAVAAGIDDSRRLGLGLATWTMEPA